jgi:hypothetical protein
MKTRMMKMMGWMLMIVSIMSLTSCEVEIRPWYDDVHHSNNTYELCSRIWEETWIENGNKYTQRLYFNNNRTGRDYVRIEYRDGCVSEDTYHFKWRWDDDDCIRMEYGPGDISYLENIRLYSNTLTGYLDDVKVVFKGRL